MVSFRPLLWIRYRRFKIRKTPRLCLSHRVQLQHLPPKKLRRQLKINDRNLKLRKRKNRLNLERKNLKISVRRNKLKQSRRLPRRRWHCGGIRRSFSYTTTRTRTPGSPLPSTPVAIASPAFVSWAGGVTKQPVTPRTLPTARGPNRRCAGARCSPCPALIRSCRPRGSPPQRFPHRGLQ